MDVAKTLIRSVVRSFYDTRQCLVIDALMVHSTLPSEDLAFLLGMQTKDLRKLCSRLREDRLLSVHSRQELREGQQRPINRDYYYIDFHVTVDAIKYRLWHLSQRVKDLYKPSEEKKDYYCKQCKAQWTQLEVLDSIDMATGEFLCHRCGFPLERHETSAADRAGHERYSKLMAQLDAFLTLLKEIDASEVPQNDFATALTLQVPVVKDPTQAHDARPRFTPVRTDANNRIAAAIRAGNTSAAAEPAPLAISLVDAATQEAERRAAARKQEAQNRLPEWHTHSTVTGQKTELGVKEAAAEAERAASDAAHTAEREAKAERGGDEQAAAKDAVAAQVDEYFAKLREQQRLAKAESDEEEEDDDDDDDDFEDVDVAGTGTATPAKSINGGAGTPSRNGIIPRSGGGAERVRRDSDSSSSAGTPAGRASPSKRVKLESGGAVAAAAAGGDDDSDDEDDFVDV